MSAARASARHRQHDPTIRESLREYGRGLAGGFLFSMPLLYTMEVWWMGLTVSPGRMLVGLAGAYLLLCAYNAYAGLHHDTTLTEILIDSIEELGLGIAVAALVLVMVGRLQSGALADVIGQIVLEGLFVAVGVSVGTAQLMSGKQEQNGRGGRGRHDSIQAELTLAMCGAVLIAANVAPTDEILMLAMSMNAAHLFATMVVSVLLALTLIYFSHFRGSARFAEEVGSFAVVEGTTVTYAMALVVSAAILWFFGAFENNAISLCVAQVVVLGLPSTLGASAGRLLLR